MSGDTEAFALEAEDALYSAGGISLLLSGKALGLPKSIT